MNYYRGEFSDKEFFKSIYKCAKKAGIKIIYYALILYFTLQDGKVPAKAKSVIMSTLGYLFLPFDMIPDLMLGIGFADDLMALIAALATTIMYVTPEIKAKAKKKVKDIFGNKVAKELAIIDAQMENDIRKYRL